MGPKNKIGINDLNEKIHRIYSKGRFLDLLQNREHALVSPTKWDDPFENFFLKSEMIIAETNERVSLENLAQDWYGQCWNLGEESDAMWRIYSSSKDSIRITTTIGELFSSIQDPNNKFPELSCFIGKVKYLDEREIKNLVQNLTFQDVTAGGRADGFAELLCIKRTAFEHEREVRILFQDVEGNFKGRDMVLKPFDVNALCSEVVLDPRQSDSDAALLKAELQNKGCSINIRKSDLYRVPKFTIRSS